MAKPYKDEDGLEYQYKPVDYYDGTDVGADGWLLDGDSQGKIQAFKNTWAEGDKAYKAAQAAGDQAGMDAAQKMMDDAHAGAEAERAKGGYQGGANGGAYNPLAGQKGAGAQAEPFTYEKAPEYLSRNQELIDAAMEMIRGREPFSYDPEQDPAYQQYKDQYTRQGKLAMEDTLGQVSARTGGLASSYAGSAAQQSYNQYMAALSDKIPELRQLAYQMYRDEGDDMRADLNMLLNREQMDYGRYQDKLGQYNADRSFQYGAWSDQQDRKDRAEETAYKRNQDALERQQYEEEKAYQRGREERQDANDEYDRQVSKAMDIFNATGDVTGLAEAWGLTPDQAQTMIDDYARQKQLTQEEAAIEIAKEQAAIGDWSGYDGLGWDTSYAKQMQDYDLKKAADSGVRSSSGGGGGDPEEDPESAAYKDVAKKATAYDDPQEAKSYLERMVDSKAISPEEAAYIYQVLLGGEVEEPEEPSERPPQVSMSQQVMEGLMTGGNPAMEIYQKKFGKGAKK